MTDGRTKGAGGGGTTARRRSRLRPLLLGCIGILYLISVPWYRSADGTLRLTLGMPDWVAVAVLCYAAVAVLNSAAWWVTDIDDEGPLPDSLPERPPGAGHDGDARGGA